MVVEPYAVRIATPIAIPIIRATVTIALAIPNAARPALSTAAVLRGVTVSPNPNPKPPRTRATVPIVTAGVQPDISQSVAAQRISPARVTKRSDRTRTANPDRSAPTAVAPARA